MSKLELTDEKIYRIVKGFVKNHTIMFMYHCGARSYGTVDEASDIDVSVIMADINGSMHMQIGGLDVFIYGVDTYLEKQSLKDNIPIYYKMHIDDAINIDKNLIFLDDRFINEYNAYKDIKLEENLKSFLSSFVKYYTVREVDHPGPAKTLYHIFRIRGLLDHFDKVDKYEMIIEEPWKSKLFTYKKNWNNDIGLSMMEEVKEQLEYIKNYTERL